MTSSFDLTGKSAIVMGSDDSQSPREMVVRDIIRGLYEGRYKPGQRLIESQLTAAYGISRGPVREALNRLAATGAVELTLQRGANVRLLTLKQAIDILLVAEGLVRIAARLAATRIDELGAQRLRDALDKLLQFAPSSAGAEYALSRNRFYATLTDIAGNSELSRILPGVQIDLIRIQFGSVMKSSDRNRRADYKRITEAILAGRPAAAESGVQIHFGRAIEDLKALAK